MACDKKTESVKTSMSEALLLALTRMANAEDRSVSEYIERVLRFHAFGHAARLAAESEGSVSPSVTLK